MADFIVIEEFSAYLITHGIGQVPSAAESTSLPSIWMSPRDGAPLPRDGENATITLSDTLAKVPSPLEQWMEEAFVDVIVRARSAPAGKLIQRRIHDLIVPYASSGGQKQWMMNGLLVEISDEWRGDQPLPQRQSVAEADPHISVDRVQSFRFSCRRKILAGLSFP